MANTPGLAAKFFGALGDRDINILAIAQGSSERNISVSFNNRNTNNNQNNNFYYILGSDKEFTSNRSIASSAFNVLPSL